MDLTQLRLRSFISLTSKLASYVELTFPKVPAVSSEVKGCHRREEWPCPRRIEVIQQQLNGLVLGKMLGQPPLEP